MLVAVPGLVENLPSAALAAVVIAAASSLVDVAALRRLYHLRRSEFVLSAACFLGVALVGVIPGIFIAVGLSLGAFVVRSWRPYDAVLGRIDGRDGYHDVSRHPEARLIPGLVLFRWDAPLFFANAEVFHDHVKRAVRQSPSPTQWVVVAAEPITDVDTTAADAVAALIGEMASAGVVLCFAEMKGPVKDRLARYGLVSEIGPDRFFSTIGSAVDHYLAATGIEWIDWKDARDPVLAVSRPSP
jgi:MFS superfamily sulfate permease-like transporter